MEQARWTKPTEIKAVYGTADVVGNNRIVFDICGNRYRLIVQFNYEVGWPAHPLPGVEGKKSFGEQTMRGSPGVLGEGAPSPRLIPWKGLSLEVSYALGACLYKAALMRIDELMNAEEGTPEVEELEVLAKVCDFSRGLFTLYMASSGLFTC